MSLKQTSPNLKEINKEENFDLRRSRIAYYNANNASSSAGLKCTGGIHILDRLRTVSLIFTAAIGSYSTTAYGLYNTSR